MTNGFPWPPRAGHYAEQAERHLLDEEVLDGAEPTAIALRARAQALAQLEVAAAIDRRNDLEASR